MKNIHVHKDPTIWPLDKDSFDVADVDHAATSFTDLNFIVEHVGLPRVEDFCWIGVQEPNVYGGLAVFMPCSGIPSGWSRSSSTSTCPSRSRRRPASR